MSLRLLVLGGTQFVGRHLVEVALERGHRVTLFHRGRTGKGLFPEATEILGDRDGGLIALAGQHFDWVLDCCGYVPRIVQQSVDRFLHQAERYLFVSTISVYASHARAGLHEGDEVARIDDPEIEVVDGRTYGALKALCEERVLHTFGERALIPRPGIIAGPHDPTDRFSYWVARAARGGTILAPAPSQQPVQLIDVRDLAAFLINQVEENASGILNTAGPEGRDTFGSMLAACQEATGSASELRWVESKVLEAQGVEPVKDLPLWLPGRNYAGLFQAQSVKARAKGLAHRALVETARDTWKWMQTWPENQACKVGLTPEAESTALAVGT